MEKRRSSGGSRAEPRGGSSSSIRSERARGRCGRNYQHKSRQPSCTSGSKLTHVAGKAQCCEHDAAATLPSPERAQLFLRTHRHPLCSAYTVLYWTCTCRVRPWRASICSAPCVRGGDVTALRAVAWPMYPPAIYNPYVNEREGLFSRRLIFSNAPRTERQGGGREN